MSAARRLRRGGVACARAQRQPGSQVARRQRLEAHGPLGATYGGATTACRVDHAGTSIPPQALRFVPVELASPAAEVAASVGHPDADRTSAEAAIHIELQRGATRLTVQWPGSQAAHCAAWLGEVAAALK